MPGPASDLRERIRALPGMDSLLPALEGLPPVYLVGGAVRDLMLGGSSPDLDLAVEGDPRPVARASASTTMSMSGDERPSSRSRTAPPTR